jgi:carboxyl-terminal processing protease
MTKNLKKFFIPRVLKEPWALARVGSIFFAIFVCLFLLTSFAISAIDQTKRDETYQELDLFADALTFVQSQYVEAVQPEDLIYGAIQGMVSNLDPHSQFLTPEEFEDLKIDTEGKFGGIGIEITIKDGLVTVITPMEGTPAWEAGFKPNDRIVKIDSTVIKYFTLNQAVKKLRGKPGTEVSVVVWREQDNRLYSFKLKRAQIDVKDIKDVKVIDGTIGYLKLVEFREDTPRDLDRVLVDLKNKGIQSLILDLRNNPGGLLTRAIDVTERFLPKGALVVSIKSRDEKESEEYRSNFGNNDTKLSMVVLVNDGSASGSEILAGALKDHKRAVIIGTKTFGKGSVQTVLPLRDGSAIKLTTSRYYTPGGHVIHNEGVTPDVVVEPNANVAKKSLEQEEYVEKIFEQVEGKKLPEVPKPAPVEKKSSEDVQLARAIDLLKSTAVYKNIKEK